MTGKPRVRNATLRTRASSPVPTPPLSGRADSHVCPCRRLPRKDTTFHCEATALRLAQVSPTQPAADRLRYTPAPIDFRRLRFCGCLSEDLRGSREPP